MEPFHYIWQPICAIVGGKKAPATVLEMAYFAGKVAVESGFAVLTGGLGGVMEEAARGAAEANGLTLGLLPGLQHREANPFVRLVLPTGIGIARNVLTAAACNVMLALPGERGTLQEILFALDFGRPVISWDSHTPAGVVAVACAERCRIRALLCDYGRALTIQTASAASASTTPSILAR